MKRLIFSLFVATTLFFTSCGADQKTVNKMADEMCVAMKSYNPKDPIGSLSALKKISAISKKQDEYGSVTEGQLQDAMKSICPEGFKKFVNFLKKNK